jgi:phosphate transport system permease protein
LGATHEQTVFKVMVPAARSGITASLILGIGRALGETMAVKMVLSNSPAMPKKFFGLFDSFSTLTTHIVNGYNEAGPAIRDLLVSAGAVLFVFILLLNMCLKLLTGGIKREKKERKHIALQTEPAAAEFEAGGTGEAPEEGEHDAKR